MKLQKKKQGRVFFSEEKKQKTFVVLACVLVGGGGPLSTVRSNYLTGCGGCHGIEGQSYAPKVPDLAGQAGYFLCTQEGRDYLARLPNVAFAHLETAKLAAVMNYVVFTLGARSAPADARPYSAAELAAGRAAPLDSPDLLKLRSGVVAGILKTCPAAHGLLAYGAP